MSWPRLRKQIEATFGPSGTMWNEIRYGKIYDRLYESKDKTTHRKHARKSRQPRCSEDKSYSPTQVRATG
jgi:hypothetical protein